MTNLSINHKFNLLARSKSFWHLSTYFFITLNIILVLSGSRPLNHPAIFLGLSALLALWYIPFITTSHFDLGGHQGKRILYFFIGWILWAGLVSLNQTSLLLIGMFCPIIFIRFPIRRAIAFASIQIVAIYTLYAFLYQLENWATLLSIVSGVAIIANLIGYSISDKIQCRVF